MPDLPRALAAAGIVFLGPRADAMAALGDKVASSILAQSAGVPTLPWSGSGVTLNLSGDAAGGVPRIPDAVYKAACVDSEAAAVASCNEIGYPIMIKARVPSTLVCSLLRAHRVLCDTWCVCHAQFVATRRHVVCPPPAAAAPVPLI